jgi:putative ABC transport system permease protein
VKNVLPGFTTGWKHAVGVLRDALTVHRLAGRDVHSHSDRRGWISKSSSRFAKLLGLMIYPFSKNGLDPLRKDLGYSLRMLCKHPILSIIIILTFGLGIGLTTMVFSITNGILFKGLPVADADRLMAVGRTDPAHNVRFMSVSVHDFLDWRKEQDTFENLAAYDASTFNVTGSEGRPERYSGALVTVNLFDVLRVQPILGRGFREGEDEPGAQPVILIGYDVWQERFGGSPEVLGQTLQTNAQTRSIIGVAPKGFMFPSREQIWAPLITSPSATKRGEGPSLAVIGRLKEGVSVDEAEAELVTIAKRLEQEYPESNEGMGAAVLPIKALSVGPPAYYIFYTLLAAAIGVLLVACSNVGNLMLAHVSVRSREVAVRTALGASRPRVVAQLMTEVLVLSSVGAVLGVALGYGGIEWFRAATTIDPPPFWIVFDMDLRVALFVIAMTLFSALFSGLIPALRATAGNLSEALKDETLGTSSFRLGKFGDGLIVAEVALSCGILVVAGLMIKSVVQLRTTEFPFATKNVLTASLTRCLRRITPMP